MFFDRLNAVGGLQCDELQLQVWALELKLDLFEDFAADVHRVPLSGTIVGGIRKRHRRGAVAKLKFAGFADA